MAMKHTIDRMVNRFWSVETICLIDNEEVYVEIDVCAYDKDEAAGKLMRSPIHNVLLTGDVRFAYSNRSSSKI